MRRQTVVIPREIRAIGPSLLLSVCRRGQSPGRTIPAIMGGPPLSEPSRGR